MSVEQAKSPEVTSRDRYCLFIPGAGNNYAGSNTINAQLSEIYGPDKIKVMNSGLFSTDTPDQSRFKIESAYIEQALLRGGEIDLYLHSAAAAEAKVAFETLKKRNPDLYNDPEQMKRINIMLIAPAGFAEGGKNAGQFIGGYVKFLRNQVMMAPVIAPPLNPYRAFEGADAFPPQNMSSEQLTRIGDNAFGDIAQNKKCLREVPLREPSHNYYPHLPVEVQREVEAYDAMIKAAEEQGNVGGMRQGMEKRAKLLNPYTGKAYAGEYFDPKDAVTPDQSAQAGPTLQARKNELRMMLDIVRGKPAKIFREIEDKGAHVMFAEPEQDILIPLKTLRDYVEGRNQDPQDKIVVIKGSSHAGRLVHDRNLFRDLEAVLREERK